MRVQIIVDKNVVILGDTSVNMDCSDFKGQFIFCEVNEKEKWVEKESFNGREQVEVWTEIEEFLEVAKVKSNQPNSYSVWNEVTKTWIEDINLKKEYKYNQWKAERQLKVDNIEVELNGVIYQGDETSQTRIARAVSVMEDTDTVMWVAKDNSVNELSKADLKYILKEAGTKQTLIWNDGRPECQLGGL